MFIGEFRALLESSSKKSKVEWDPRFYPSYTPKQMLHMGVFGGLYLNSDRDEFPEDWFDDSKLSDDQKPHKELNFFGVLSGMSWAEWKKRGWIHKQDPKGWFQWYCRYYMGRRSEDDDRQIKRWASVIKRHGAELNSNAKDKRQLKSKDYRPVQKQALLQWAWDYEQDPNDEETIKKNIAKVSSSTQK